MITGLQCAAISLGFAFLAYVIGFIHASRIGLAEQRAYGDRLRANFQTVVDRHVDQKDALQADLTRQNTAVLRLRADLSSKQRRVRGVLTEARRWKAIAASLGWKRETRGEMHARQRREAGET